MVCSASMTSLSSRAEPIYLYKHGVFLAIAILSGTIAATFPALFWRRSAPFLYLVVVGLLVAVLLPGIGHRVNGSQRWLRLAGISLQPSEIAKLCVPMLICWFRVDAGNNLKPVTIGQMSRITAIVAIPLGLILFEPDLGTTLFIAIIAGLTLFLSGLPIRYFLLAGVLLAPACVGLVALKPYQLARIQGFIQTWTNPDAAPYQVKQSLTTLGVGGIQGTGLGRGWQKLSFLPEANTDFIFSVIGEELGLIGTAGVLALWLGLYVSGLRMVRNCTANSFESLLASVLLTQLVLQAALNVAVVTALVPPKGISHPLISYGGSNLVMSVTAIGMVISLTRSPLVAIATVPQEELLDSATTSVEIR